MKQRVETNALLQEIADKAGVAFLSDLKQVQSANFLFSVFADIEKKEYTIEDWKNAVSYIFGLSRSPDIPLANKEIILWNTGQWGQYITEVLEKYFAAHKISCCFYHVTGEYGPKLSPNKKYLVFYHPSSLNREEAKSFARHEHLNLYFAAICGDYKDGILSLENGDTYALKLPLEEEKVIRCFEHFSLDLLKKEAFA